MSSRIRIDVDLSPISFIGHEGAGGHGRTGQVKRASWLGRSITIERGNREAAIQLNRGSFIDFVNAKLAPGEKALQKGWLFGWIGGSSDDEIKKAFANLVMKKSPLESKGAMTLHIANLQMKPENPSQINLYGKTQAQIEGLVGGLGGVCLARYDNEPGNIFRGIAIIHEDNEWILHLCPGVLRGDLDEKNFDWLMPKAITQLMKNKILPKYYSRANWANASDTLEDFENWQKKNKEAIKI